ncbi:hypothetical protein A1O1_07494 [Capronia coronata CBS 617.96]|uniref:Uncharacterized protein n=1 Tax=Capronia coronata CBS 617.96 TaxID=1182541 RepID=W9Y3U9_9EURO|nr:uncharacterized protein A1O1_07494 [Capronia coronata CBS 617.96]EXJ83866.1 hypothetical protein A1O1_07494 [Capronia coronata CBS 617.96]
MPALTIHRTEPTTRTAGPTMATTNRLRRRAGDQAVQEAPGLRRANSRTDRPSRACITNSRLRR